MLSERADIYLWNVPLPRNCPCLKDSITLPHDSASALELKYNVLAKQIYIGYMRAKMMSETGMECFESKKADRLVAIKTESKYDLCLSSPGFDILLYQICDLYLF